jgi:glycosyltransferase involved in cell wall biosynthesis
MMNNTLRILMINDHIHFSGGGDATFMHERGVYEDAGYEVFTFSQATEAVKGKTDRDILYINSPNRIIQKAGKYIFNPGVYYALRCLLKKINPSFVHAHLISKYPASIYAALEGYPVAQTLHGSARFCATGWGCLKKDSSYCELGIGAKCYLRGCIPLHYLPLCWFFYSANKRHAQKSVKFFIGPSRQICEAAEKDGFAPAEYIPLCIDKMFYSEPPLDRPGPPTIVYAGGMSPQKGVEILLDAFLLVLKQLPDARLTYAGRGKLLAKLKEKTRKYGIDKSVDFLGFVGHDRISEVYYKGHIFVMPSIWSEQFGLVGCEALACGLPVIASNIGGIPEWLKDGQWGYLTPPRDIKILAEKIILLLKNKDLRAQFAQKGRKFILCEYGVERFKFNMLGLVERFVGKRPHGLSDRTV